MKIFWTRLAIAFLGGFLLGATAIIVDGTHDRLGKCDVGVILGSKVELNGTPSLRLRVRLDRGVELFRKGYFNHVIVSGGLGKEGFYEARVMRKYLVNHGVPNRAIIIDDRGRNTMETAVNTQAIMKRSGFRTVMIITQYYHIARTRLAFSKCGISPVYQAHGVMILEPRDLYAIGREVIGYLAYKLRKP